MLKRIVFSIVAIVASSSLFSEEFSKEYFDSFSYYFKCLQKEESNFSVSEQTLYEKLIFLQNMHNIVLDFLNTADDENFYDQLRQSKYFTRKLSEINNQIFSEIHQDRYCDRRIITLNGVPTPVYYAFYKRTSDHAPLSLTDDERKKLYEDDLIRHKNVKFLPKQILNKKTLKTLVSGQTYNFIITLENKAYISYDQRYKLKDDASQTILSSPNHTLLAGNEPVLSVGVINYYKVSNKELFVISCSSGHFHPQPDSLIYIKNYLMTLGIPEEAIINFAIAYEKIDAHLNALK